LKRSNKEGKGLIHDPVVKKIGEKHGKTEAQVLLRFLTQSGLLVIPRSTKPERIKSNFEVLLIA
jgi:diketogulonate reductase-like aldo/keto reductase